MGLNCYVKHVKWLDHGLMATWYLIRYIHDTFICKECYFPEGQYQVN